MKVHAEKRAYKRYPYITPIVFSYFNKRQSFENYTLNICLGGMSFKSDIYLHPESTILIRKKEFNPNGAYIGDCKGLRTIMLAEVKWCKEVIDAIDSFYEVGVKYFEPEY
jgi:hypothetical protein